MKFDLKELLQAGNHKWKESEIDLVTRRNLEDLCRKINKLGYNPPMYASSCLRSIKDQQRINPKAMGSSHLYGAAVDIADPKGALSIWVKNNKQKIIDCGLWVENPDCTKGWIHFQIYAPKSFTRFFNP